MPLTMGEGDRHDRPADGAARLLKALLREGLAERAVGRAAALVMQLEREALARRELAERELGELAVPKRRCSHREHEGDPWLPLKPEHFYLRPNGIVAAWC